MCGLCGKVSSVDPPPALITAMADALQHRGPDDHGVYLGQGVGLGHRRLSIIDLSSGKQPISNEDGTVWIVFNGEIYNYKQLRPDLLRRGHRFRTDGDTEVIVHLYEEFGTACVEHLRGMFAFALWDATEKRLFAARDHLGQKPFFYAERGSDLLFGSEIKALLAADPSLAELDFEALSQYLTLRVIAPPRSMFRGIRKLPPSHWMTFDQDTGVHVERYWDPSYLPKLPGTDEELAEELERRLIECIALHLVSDVPVGAFLSGGLDSTLVTAIAMKNGLADDLQTFSVGLPYGDYDEAPYAKLVAERYGTRHREKVITPSLVKTLPKLVWHMDEPSDSLTVCQYLISEMASKHVKVVLGGDGGDELFGGYDRYYGDSYVSYYAMIPQLVRRRGIGPLLALLPDGRWYKSVAHQLKWIHSLSFHAGGDRYAKSLGYFYFGESLRASLYGPSMLAAASDFDPDASIREPYERVIADDALDRMLYADSQVRLVDHPVVILDRMTMAHGLEARSPFMDHKLAEFAARLPVRMKVRGRRTRLIQRLVAERYLPDRVLERPKQGFQSALPYMLRDEYKLLFSLFLRSSELVADGILLQGPIDEMREEHLIGKADHANRLWLILNAEIWYRMFIRGTTVDSVFEEIAAATHQSARVA